MQATWSDRFRGLKDTPAVLLLIVGITGLSWAVFGYGDEHSTLMSADSVSSILDTHNQGGGREIHSLSELTESEKMEAWWAFLAACERATTVESVRIYSRAIGQLIGIVCLVAGGLRFWRVHHRTRAMPLRVLADDVRCEEVAANPMSRVA